MRGPAGFIAWASVVLALLAFHSCGSPVRTPTPELGEPLKHDSATVILSKYYSSRNYRNWLGRLNDSLDGPPLRFVQAYGLDLPSLIEELSVAKAVVLTGGEDIHPSRYGQAADTLRCGRIDEARDRVEHELLDAVYELGLPCLGVCRGLQVMNVHGGGTLRPHLPDDGFEGHRGGSHGNTRDTAHLVEVQIPWSFGNQVWSRGDSATVISHHHQGIGELALGFEPWAASPDGLIEGIRWADTTDIAYLVGVQYHPERSRAGSVLSDGLGAGLLEALAARR